VAFVMSRNCAQSSAWARFLESMVCGGLSAGRDELARKFRWGVRWGQGG